jgi:Domain of unknown function (DUF4375)
MRRDYRRRMSAGEFNAIRIKDDDAVFGYFEKLIAKNDKFQPFFTGNAKEWPFADLTKGQRFLIVLNAFDGQIANGGLTQFFWNIPQYVFHVRDAIELFGPRSLLEEYDKAIEKLVGKKERWLELRDQCYSDPENPCWEPFRASYELLDLEKFDNGYLDTWGYDARKRYVRTRRGWNEALLGELVKYIRSHPADFIEE